MLDGNNWRRLVFGLVITAVIASATILAFDFQKSSAITMPSRVDAVQFSYSTPVRVVVIHPNEEKVITLNLMAPPQLPLQLKTGVTERANEMQFAHGGKSVLPNGISVTLDKQFFNLAPISSSSQALIVRDTNTVTISASQYAQVGNYTLVAVLMGDHQGSGTGVILEVQK